MVTEEEIQAFANAVEQLGDLALELADGDPLRAQQLLDTTAFMYRRLFNKSDATATMEELEEEYIREAEP